MISEICPEAGRRTMYGGVVFELISGDSLTWTWASPMIAALRDQLQTKYPGLDVVVVSHGPEQFQLTRSEAGKQVVESAHREW